MFTSIAPVETFRSCGIRTEGTIACWGDEVVPRPPDGTFAALSDACAIRTDGTLLCWNPTEGVDATPPPGTFTALSTTSIGGCAIRTDQALVCWGVTFIPPSATDISTDSATDAVATPDFPPVGLLFAIFAALGAELMLVRLRRTAR
jgi:hypothetical protein